MSFGARIRRMVIVTCGLVLVQCCGAVAEQNPAAQESSRAGQTFRIAGTVVSATTGEPLSQARISVAETRDRAKSISMVTSED